MEILPSIWVDTVVTSQQIHPQKFKGGFSSATLRRLCFLPLLLIAFPLLSLSSLVDILQIMDP
jgi:hypothetical protein